MAKLTDKDDNALTDSNDILQEGNSVFFNEKLYERRDVEDCKICWPRQLCLNSYYKKKYKKKKNRH